MCSLGTVWCFLSMAKIIYYFPSYVLFSLIPMASGQSYGNITYHALGIVKSIHLLPRFNQQFYRSSNDFDIDTSDLQNEYTESVIMLPIVLASLIFIAFTLFELALCCRYCCPCCRCVETSPERSSIHSMAIWTNKVTSSRLSLVRAFWVFAFLAFLACQGIIAGAIFIFSGSHRGMESADDLYHIAIGLKHSGEYLENSGDLILNLTAKAIPTCPEASFVQDYADDFDVYVSEYQDIINPIPNDLNKMEDFLHTYGVQIISISIWVTYSCVMMTLLAIVITYRTRNRSAVKVSIGWGAVILHVLLVGWCLCMITMIVLADFCMAPTDNAISVTPDSALDVATYYGTCNGTNPFDESLTSAYAAVDDLNSSITFLVQQGGLCENNPYLLACYPPIDDIYSNLTSISEGIQCQPIQNEWATVFNKSVCRDYYQALYIVFETLIGILVTFFPLLIISSILYQYFGSLWKAEEGHVLEIPIRDSEGNPLGSLPGISMTGSDPSDSSITYSTLIYEERPDRSVNILPAPPSSSRATSDSISKEHLRL